MDKVHPLENLRHSLAHLLAAAVMELWPNTKRAIGPVIENGFYYDFEFAEPISESDLPKIEKKMGEILLTWKEFRRTEISADEARVEFSDNLYKLELIDEFSKNGETLTLYQSGNYVDLCRGGHVGNASDIDPDAFKLTRLAGAYWRGSEKNPQLTRIYGVAFDTKQKLDEYLAMLEEAEKRDHKKLGPQLDLFMFHETAPGMPYWLPKGVLLYNTLIEFWRKEHQKRNYHEIVSPLVNKRRLYEISGHYEHYWENMFVSKTPDEEEYGLKAMNCPNAMIVFGSKLRSYRDLPLRFSDTDPLHRYELSGTLNGLFRVREFRQDDAHCFVTEDQIGEEYQNIFEIVERFYSIFNLPYFFRLGTRPESFLGDIETWDTAEATLKTLLEESGKQYLVEEGDGAFYGPKIDIIMKDTLGREWQMGTIQLDFQQPRRFKLGYIDEDGKEKTPVAIHRVIYGSLERFIGILIEHYAGAFPFWLAPVQATLLPINDKNKGYVSSVAAKLKTEGIRLDIDERNESIGKKIREAEMQKIPYLLVIGNKEAEAGTVALRKRGDGDQGSVAIDDCVKKFKEENIV
ncbi:MAG: threonine--tRNA ligase [Candidatus Sungbacteria bacterium]|nr:threonine--tRNA ligase [Candidatus Sungbacteria bacterium]